MEPIDEVIVSGYYENKDGTISYYFVGNDGVVKRGGTWPNFDELAYWEKNKKYEMTPMGIIIRDLREFCNIRKVRSGKQPNPAN